MIVAAKQLSLFKPPRSVAQGLSRRKWHGVTETGRRCCASRYPEATGETISLAAGVWRRGRWLVIAPCQPCQQIGFVFRHDAGSPMETGITTWWPRSAPESSRTLPWSLRIIRSTKSGIVPLAWPHHSVRRGSWVMAHGVPALSCSTQPV